MFITHPFKLFTNLTNRRSLAETYCRKRWDYSIWMTGVGPELPLTHIVLSVQQFILQNKEYWNIPNLTAGNFFLLSKREIKSLRQLRALSDRQPKVQSVIFQSWISTPETLKSLSLHLTAIQAHFPSVFSKYLSYTDEHHNLAHRLSHFWRLTYSV